MKYFSLLAAVLFFYFGKIYSVQNNQKPSDKIKIDSILIKADNFFGRDFDSTLYFARKGLFQAQKINYVQGLQKASHIIGSVFVYSFELDSARLYLNAAIEYAKELDDKTGLVNSYNNLGYVYDEMNDWENAVDCFKESLLNSLIIKDTSGIVSYYLNMSIIYDRLTDYETSLDYLITAENLAKQIEDSLSIGVIYTNISKKYYEAGDIETALKYIVLSREIFYDVKDYGNLATAYFITSELFRTQKQYEKSARFIDSATVYYSLCNDDYGENAAKSLRADILIEDKKYDESVKLLNEVLQFEGLLDVDKIEIFYQLGNIYFLQSSFPKAKMYLKKALEIPKTPDELEITVDIYKLLVETAKKERQYKKAFDYYALYSKLNDSLKVREVRQKGLNFEKLQKLRIKEKEYKNLLREQKIKNLELERELLIRNHFFAFAVLLIVALLVGGYQIRKIRKLNDSLKNYNLQKEKFLRIISHDVKNSLGAVLNFSEMIMTDIESLSKEELAISVNEINRAAASTNNLLTNLLEWSLTFDEKKELQIKENNLKELVDEGISSSASARKIKSIECVIDIPEQLNVKVDANSIISVVRNLCTNAIKFSHENSTIKVYAKKLDNVAEVTIEDEGVGMTKEDLETLFSESGKKKSARGTMNEKGTGLGLSLVKTFVENNGGKIRAESEPGKGSKFIFTIPLA